MVHRRAAAQGVSTCVDYLVNHPRRDNQSSPCCADQFARYDSPVIPKRPSRRAVKASERRFHGSGATGCWASLIDELRALGCSGTSGPIRRKGGRDSGRLLAAHWMAPALRAYPLLLPRLRGDVVHDVVASLGISAHAGWHVVEQQDMPRLPTDVVIGA